MHHPQVAHLALAMLKKAEERVLHKLVCQDIELCQVGQGGDREQVILVSLHMLEMNCNACDGVTDLTDSSYNICMGRAACCELLVLLSLVESSQIVTSHSD